MKLESEDTYMVQKHRLKKERIPHSPNNNKKTTKLQHRPASSYNMKK